MTTDIKEFTPDEQERLSEHFSNTDKNVFTITTPNQVDRGALMSRYSRSNKSMRRIFLDEFANDATRGETFYDKILSDYGDDSVAELGFAQIGIEDISNIAVKTIEDHRIGLSYLEKSSRYVDWSKKNAKGEYQFFRGQDILSSKCADMYLDACNLSFDTYSKGIPIIQKYLREKYDFNSYETANSREKKPLDLQQVRRTHESAIRAKTFDILRGLLPASTTTNLAIAGNGRAFEYLINTLLASPLEEEHNIGKQIKEQLDITIEPFIKRVYDIHGIFQREYLIRSRRSQEQEALYEQGNWPYTRPRYTRGVNLEHYILEESAACRLVTDILYPHCDAPYGRLYRYVQFDMPEQVRNNIIKDQIDLRKNRRHRLSRAFEIVQYTFAFCTNFGMFRDLHRHRLLTMHRQKLTPYNEFTLPKEITEAGLDSEFKECMESSKNAFKEMALHMPNECQYVVNFAYNYRYTMHINLREACHLIELRTTPHGHHDYRKVAQDMYHQIKKVHPNLSQAIKFVNLSNYDDGLERLEEEKRAAKKVKSLNEQQ